MVKGGIIFDKYFCVQKMNEPLLNRIIVCFFMMNILFLWVGIIYVSCLGLNEWQIGLCVLLISMGTMGFLQYKTSQTPEGKWLKEYYDIETVYYRECKTLGQTEASKRAVGRYRRNYDKQQSGWIKWPIKPDAVVEFKEYKCSP